MIKLAKGQQSKNIIAQKILDTFEGSFQYDKEIRVPIMEDGELIQIKVTLTAAKTNVEQGGENAIPGDEVVKVETPVASFGKIEATAEEKENVRRLLQSLNL